MACLRLKLQKKYWSLFNNNTFCKKNENFNRISTSYTTKLGTFHSISVTCVSFSFHFNFSLWNREAFSAATLLAYYILLQLWFGAIFVYMLSPGRIVLCFHLSKIDENRWQRTFFDERNLDSNTQRHENKPLKRYLETTKAKKRYNSQILNLEKGLFTPLVFSIKGGMGRKSPTFMLVDCSKTKRIVKCSYVQN